MSPRALLEESPGVEAASIDLTVCIPTYNRAAFTAALVDTVRRTMARLSLLDFEIVVSDNHSPDGTASTCRRLVAEDPRVRLVQPDRHFPTAEENLEFAIRQCRGRYVWVLGDDDDPHEPGVRELIRYVVEDRVDMVVFNSRSHSYDGLRLKDSRIPCPVHEWRGGLLEFARRTGFWFVLAGFSTLLLKRPQDKVESYSSYLKISKIYSHVSWLLEAYAGAEFRFCNTPLVSYRQNLSDARPDEHWKRVAHREGLFAKGLWTNGWLRLTDRLIERGIVDRGYLRTVVDRHLGHRFIFADEVLKHFLDQLTINQVERDKYFDRAEFAYFVEWSRDLFPEASAIVVNLEAALDSMDAEGRINPAKLEALWALLHARNQRPWYRHFFVEQQGPYELFQHGTLCWAMRLDAHKLAHRCTEPLEVIAAGSYILKRDDLSGLRVAIDAELRQEAWTEGFGEISEPVVQVVDVIDYVRRNGADMVRASEMDDMRRTLDEARRYAEAADARGRDADRRARALEEAYLRLLGERAVERSPPQAAPSRLGPRARLRRIMALS